MVVYFYSLFSHSLNYFCALLCRPTIILVQAQTDWHENSFASKYNTVSFTLSLLEDSDGIIWINLITYPICKI